jgi:hypothetical protein
MDAQLMLRTGVLLLVLTALAGVIAAGFRFSGRPHPPSFVAMLHGLLAASGLTLVVYVCALRGLPENGWIGLVTLVVAVIGGLVLNLRFHWNKQPLPVWLVLLHAVLAAGGLLVLGLSAWAAFPEGGR